MEHQSRYRGFLWRLIAAAVVPCAALSAIMWFAHGPSRWLRGLPWYGPLALSVALGALFIVTLPIPSKARFVWSIIYVLSVPLPLIYYCVIFNIVVLKGDGF
jgi:hypothetical protein